MKKGMLVLVVVMLFGLGLKAQSEQAGWYFCNKCSDIFFGANSGVCPSGSSHSYGTRLYTIFTASSSCGGQADWAYCVKCSGLFYATSDFISRGVCAAGGIHGRGDSFGYKMCYTEQNVAFSFNYQDGFRYCTKCAILYHSTNLGVCPAGGTHSGTSYNYVIKY